MCYALLCLTAKDLAPQRKHTIKRPFKKHASVDTAYTDPFELIETPPLLSVDVPPSSSPSNTPVVGRATTISPAAVRHWSISTLKSKLSIKKTYSFHVPVREYDDDSAVSRRRDRSITTSTFYDNEHMAVTKNVSEPAEFSSLQLTGKGMNELLLLLKPVSWCVFDLSPCK